MLHDTIELYLGRFQSASYAKRYDRTLALLEELKKELRALPPAPSEVICYLNSIASQNPLPGSSLAFTAAWSNISDTYREPLCNILNCEEANAFHESVVELLEKIPDASSIGVLEKCLQYRWGYDEWLNVPRKALWALFAIGTPEAIAAIRRAHDSPDELIRDEADLLLK